MKRFLHIFAVMFSTLASIAAHGAVKPELAKKSAKKSSETALSKSHRNSSATSAAGDAAQKPPDQARIPLKLDPALMAGAEQPAPVFFSTIAPPPSRPADAASRYPWRNQIVTTTFWIGEMPTKNNPVPNQASSWDPNWSKNYGGTDDPLPANRTSEFCPANFVPGQNPFYIALPYNDRDKNGYKPEAGTVIPWFDQAKTEDQKSVCKGRWLAIRYGNKVCYAQWEDCGPFRTDHAEYVFGNERPKPNLNRGAGLDVSPAVRDFLGMNGSDVTDWKFVDFAEVPPGPWARYGENNTFVQNARGGREEVAEVSKARTPVSLRE